MKISRAVVVFALVLTASSSSAAPPPDSGRSLTVAKVAKLGTSLAALKPVFAGLPSDKVGPASCPGGGTVSGTFASSGSTAATASITFAACKSADGKATYDGGPLTVAVTENTTTSSSSKTTQLTLALQGALSVTGDNPIKLAADGLTIVVVTLFAGTQVTSSIATINGKANVDGKPIVFNNETKQLVP
jgi:hypothetical protein